MWGAFDKTYCLTLETTVERQAHAKKQFERVGIERYEFVNGFTPNDPEIKLAYKNNQVLQYPNCFRCKRPNCGCENNFIIPAQVACFKSFLKIFQKSVNSPHTSFLMIEDDVEFENYWEPIVKNHLTRNKLELLYLYSPYPCLLSLGQNYMGSNPKHMRVFQNKVVWSETDNSECNVTFAYNRAFAGMALDLFKKYNMTSDTYIHRHLGRMCIHKSLLPRLSHDLSWSTGKFKSNIHPKSLFLNHNHSIEEKRKEIQNFRNHVKKVRSKQEYQNYINKYINS